MGLGLTFCGYGTAAAAAAAAAVGGDGGGGRGKKGTEGMGRRSAEGGRWRTVSCPRKGGRPWRREAGRPEAGNGDGKEGGRCKFEVLVELGGKGKKKI